MENDTYEGSSGNHIIPLTTWSPLQYEEDVSLCEHVDKPKPLQELEREWLIDWAAISGTSPFPAGTVGIQVPEGLKPYVSHIVAKMEEYTGTNVIVLADPCFGGCDFNLGAILALGITRLFVFGQASIASCTPNRVVPVKVTSKHELSNLVRKAAHFLHRRRIAKIALAACNLFVHRLSNIAEEIGLLRLEPVIGKGDDRIMEAGQVLGCNVSSVQRVSASVDACLCISCGAFHPRGISFVFQKPILHIDPVAQTVCWYQSNATTRRALFEERLRLVHMCRTAESFGVIISTKPGQVRKQLAFDIVQRLRSAGKKAWLLALSNVQPVHLDYLPLDVFVSTACPRVAIDDRFRFKKPVLTPNELKVLLSDETEDYRFDQIVADDNDFDVAGWNLESGTI